MTRSDGGPSERYGALCPGGDAGASTRDPQLRPGEEFDPSSAAPARDAENAGRPPEGD